MKKVRVVVISGPSGSGKSTALKALEDAGFFSVDNMPVMLLEKFLELLDYSGEAARAAVVVDIRDRENLAKFPQVLASLKREGVRAELIFLEATDKAILKRYSETRRRHPLAVGSSPGEAVKVERELLGEIKLLADRVIDTTDYNVHQLKKALQAIFSSITGDESMTISLVSFGYRYGPPTDCDLLMDVRFLPNPFFINDLKALPGTDKRVSDFLLRLPETREFLKRYKDFLEYLIPLYIKEGKSYLSIAIGCTGGRHRSVAIAQWLAGELDAKPSSVRVRHRDVNRA